MMVLTPKGGHVEWLTGERSPERWVFKPTIEFLTYQAKLNGDISV